MVDSLKPGQKIRCTISKNPRSKGATDTVARLMRQDPEIAKGLRRAQAYRKRNANIHNRGGRDWYARAKAGKNLRVAPGESWTMTFVPHLAPDLRAVENVLSIETA